MERLTRKHNDGYLFTEEYLERNFETYEIETIDGFNTVQDLDTEEALFKLGQIEDTMEYWGIDSIDELNYKLNMNAYLKDNKVLEKALEIACKNIEGIYCTDYCGILKCQNCKFKQEFNANTYIEQAKKELE